MVCNEFYLLKNMLFSCMLLELVITRINSNKPVKMVCSSTVKTKPNLFFILFEKTKTSYQYSILEIKISVTLNSSYLNK